MTQKHTNAKVKIQGRFWKNLQWHLYLNKIFSQRYFLTYAWSICNNTGGTIMNHSVLTISHEQWNDFIAGSNWASLLLDTIELELVCCYGVPDLILGNAILSLHWELWIKHNAYSPVSSNLLSRKTDAEL